MSNDHRDVSARSAKQWKASAHHGAGTWLAERFSAVLLAFLTIYAAWAAWQIAGTTVDQTLAFVRHPLNAGLISLSLVVAIWHMYLGLRVIVEDYIDKNEGRGVYIFLIFLFCLVMLVAGLGGVYMIYQGGRA